MKIVTVVNYKGGVGKTTLAANIGAEIARRGRRVLLVDLDPQASLTLSFYRPEQWSAELRPHRTIRHWFEDRRTRSPSLDPRDLVTAPGRVNWYLEPTGGRLDLIASDLTLGDVEEALVIDAHRAADARSGDSYLRILGRLRDAFTALPTDAYDLALIDCPPSFGMMTRSAITASDHILVPARPDELSTVAIEHLMDRLTHFRGTYEHMLGRARRPNDFPPVVAQVLGVVYTMVRFHGSEPIPIERYFINQPRANLPVFTSVVRESHRYFAESAADSVPMVLAEKTPRHNVAEMKELVSEFVRRIGATGHG